MTNMLSIATRELYHEPLSFISILRDT